MAVAPPGPTIGSRNARALRRLLAAGSAGLTLALSTPATAEPSPPAEAIVVARFDQVESSRAREIAEGVAAELRRSGRPARLVSAPTLPADVSDRLRSAAEAYRSLRPGEARRSAEQLLASADETGGLGVTRHQLVDALLLVAMSALVLDDGGAAAAALDRLLVVDGGLELDPARYPPTVRELLEERRARHVDEGALLRITGAPEGARVLVDGEVVPVEADEVALSPGPHLLAVTAPGHVARGQRLDLAAGATTFDASLRADHEARLRDPGDPGEPAEPLVAAAGELGASLILVDVVAGAEGESASVRDTATGRSATVSDAGREAPTAVARSLVVALLAPDFSSTEDRPVAPDRPDASPRARVAWIAGGTVAAALVAAAVVLAVVLTVPADEPGDGDWEGRWSR